MTLSPTPLAGPADVRLDEAGRRAQRRRWSRIFLVAGLVTGTLWAVGVAGRALGYLIADPATRHFGTTLTPALALVLLGVIVTPARKGWRAVARVAIVIVLAFALMLTALASVFFEDFAATRYASPDGRSVVVVTEGSFGIDPAWTVTVRESSTLLARTWELGCFNGDDPDNGLESVRWVSPTLVEAVAESGLAYQVEIDPTNAKPANTIALGCS